jgi:hypothetical protein
MELTQLSAAADERPRIVFPDGRPGRGLSPEQERKNRAILAAADERNRLHDEECQARHAANLKRWNSSKPLHVGGHGWGAFTTRITSERTRATGRERLQRATGAPERSLTLLLPY